MKLRFHSLFAVGCLFVAPAMTFAQSDPFAVLLGRYGLARTPLDAEGIIVPGSLLIGGDGLTTIHVLPYEISSNDVSYSDDALDDMSVIRVESVEGGTTGSGGGGFTLQKWAPGITSKTATGMVSDQADFTVAELSSTQIDKLVLHQPEIKAIYEDWHNPKEAGRNVWLVVSVFYTKSLNVANSTQRQLALSTGGKLPDCPAALSTATPPLQAASTGGTPTVPASQPVSAPVTPASTIRSTQTSTTKPEDSGVATAGSPAPSGSVTANVAGYGVTIGVDHKASTSKKTTKENIQRGVAAATSTVAAVGTVATGLSSGTLITAFGYSCRDSRDVAHLLTQTPTAIGIKVVPVGYFTHPEGLLHKQSAPTDFTYDVVSKQPVFTMAK